jgi:hypothetical protein
VTTWGAAALAGTAASTARARTWTGRAATSRATDSALPHLVTAGTHRTRVSEMRGPAATPAAGTSAPSARSALARRLPEHPGTG